MNDMSLLAFIDVIIGVGIIATACFALLMFIALFRRGTSLHVSVSRWALPVGFALSLCAALGTLYYSEIIGVRPCTLCWYQRFLLYPQVLIMAYAFFRKDRRVFPYTMLLSTLGLIIALYHVSLPLWTSSIFCDPTAELCLIQSIHIFGFITIPMMSVVVFSTLLALSIHGRRALRKERADLRSTPAI